MEMISGSAAMAVFAVSGSVVFLSMQAHKRLLADFLAKMDSPILHNHPSSGSVLKNSEPKKVRFAEDAAAAEKAHWKKHPTTGDTRRKIRQGLEDMPKNWQAMYKGILQSRNSRMP